MDASVFKDGRLPELSEPEDQLCHGNEQRQRSSNLLNRLNRRPQLSDFPEDPFHHGITNELVDSISPSIGVMTVSWGFIEQYMSAIIEATSDEVVDHGMEVKRERQYDGKRKYLENIFAKVDALSEYKARATALFKRMEPLTKVRHCEESCYGLGRFRD